MPCSWGVVVPVKRLFLAKTRLSAYGDSTRQRLALAFAADVVSMALDCEDVTAVLVVTDDEEAGPYLAGLGAAVAPDSPDAGINPALEHGAALLRVDEPGRAIATLSADLPAATPEQLSAVLRQISSGERGFVADTVGSGTTVLAAASGAELSPAFGPRSRAGHLRQGARELVAGEGLRRDVDTPEDLAMALRLGVGRHTAELTARW